MAIAMMQRWARIQHKWRSVSKGSIALNLLRFRALVLNIDWCPFSRKRKKSRRLVTLRGRKLKIGCFGSFDNQKHRCHGLCDTSFFERGFIPILAATTPAAT